MRNDGRHFHTSQLEVERGMSHFNGLFSLSNFEVVNDRINQSAIFRSLILILIYYYYFIFFLKYCNYCKFITLTIQVAGCLLFLVAGLGTDGEIWHWQFVVTQIKNSTQQNAIWNCCLRSSPLNRHLRHLEFDLVVLWSHFSHLKPLLHGRIRHRFVQSREIEAK